MKDWRSTLTAVCLAILTALLALVIVKGVLIP